MIKIKTTTSVDGMPKKEKMMIQWNEETYMLQAKIQQGPIKEVGVNGVQVDDVIEWCKDMITKFNSQASCRENAMVITKLDEALHWLDHRTKDREGREVEGTYEE